MHWFRSMCKEFISVEDIQIFLKMSSTASLSQKKLNFIALF